MTGLFFRFREHLPAVMQPVVPLMAAGPRRRRRLVPAGPHRQAGPVRRAVVPRGLHQQPAGVGVPGFGDRPLGAVPAGGMLGGQEPQLGADGVTGEPVPVADLHGQPEPGQGGHPPQATQPAHHRGVLAVERHLGDRLVEPVPEVIKLLIRNPRAGIGFIRFGSKGIGPAVKAFERGDDAGALRVFMAANTSDTVVAGIPEAMFQRLVDNVGPLKAQLKAGFPPFGASDAKGIPVPTLLVSGAQSPAHLTAVTDRLTKLIPNAERLTIVGATHNMFNSHPAQFNAGVLRFIRSHSVADR